MGKAAGVSRRRKKVASIRPKRSKALKRVRRRELKKTGGIADEVIREAWSTKRSLRGNMATMGLAHDPNALFAGEERARAAEELAKERAKLKKTESLQSTTAKVHQKLLRAQEKKKKANKAKTGDKDGEEIKQKPAAETVADKLAKKVAATPAARNFRFGPDNVKFCAYMIEKYGEDYQAMVRDRANHYQESAGQIRAKIRRFLTIPEHQRVFLKAKELVAAELEA
ncbi:Nucleolar protein 16 [Tyrophagus putrescentiae]|nr:Nucleolar protein 16 [Tyrophagus putrescentiae]